MENFSFNQENLSFNLLLVNCNRTGVGRKSKTNGTRVAREFGTRVGLMFELAQYAQCGSLNHEILIEVSLIESSCAQEHFSS
jgi:hypothetical protein